jgi:hypothetical protein
MITLPIQIGDIVLAGRFKNKKIKVKEIGYDEYGSPTINGRSILKIRLIPNVQNMKENVTIKKVNGKYNIYKKTEDGVEDTPLNAYPYETENHAVMSAIYKGYTPDNDISTDKKYKQPKQTQHEPTKFTKPKEMKLDKEREVKLERLIRKVIGEMKLNELDVTDPKIEKLIDDLAESERQLKEAMAKIDALKKELNVAGLEKQSKQLVGELSDFLDEMKKDKERIIRTKNVVMSIDRYQSIKATYQYESVLDFAMTQVNQDVKFKILQELKATEKLSPVKGSLSFTTRTESFSFSNIINKIKQFALSILPKFVSKGKKIDDNITKLEKMTQQLKGK